VTLLLPLLVLAAAGPLEVTSLDPAQDLSGAWRCHVGDDPGYAAPGFDDSAWSTLELPGKATCGAPVDSGERRNVVWLRRELRVPASLRAEPMGLSLGEVRGVTQAFIDGALVGQRGSLDPFVDAIRTGVAHPVPDQAAADGVLHVAVRVVQHYDVAAAPQKLALIADGPLVLGHMPSVDILVRAEVDQRVNAETAVSFGFTILVLIVALYHVLVWLMRRQLRGYLWFGLFLIFANAWLATVTLTSTPALPFSIYGVGVWGNLVGTLTNVIFIEFFWFYLFGRGPTKPWRVAEAVLGVISLLGFIPVVGFALTVNPIIAIPKVAILPWAVWVFARAARSSSERKTEARVLIVGLVVSTLLAPVAAAEVLFGLELPFHAGHLALGGFMFVMAIALVIQFTGTLATVEALNKSIARFVPFGFLHALGRASVKDVVRGDSREAEMVVMFCDIRGFTPLTEKLGPEGTITMLNEYLALMEPAIHTGGGFVNQYYGDGLMCLFPGDPAGAVDAVRGMFKNLASLNEARVARGEDEINIGVALHTGPLMIGTIGGGERLDSGVIGDVVNSTARLEGMTKMYGVRAIVSGELMARLEAGDGSGPATRVLDVVLAKGKSTPLELHELLDTAAAPPPTDAYAAAFAKYRDGDFAEAAEAFKALDDAAARELAARCETLNAAPPEEWDGVYALQRK
jgi:class 3 adenylate cyclase